MQIAAQTLSAPLYAGAVPGPETPEQVRWRRGALAVDEQLSTRKRTMRTILIATTAVALIGFAGNLRADSVDLVLDEMETITAGAYIDNRFSFDWQKRGDALVRKFIDIEAQLRVHPNIKGNFADGEAAATAYGHDTFTETLSFADTVEGYMSRSGSHAVAASAPAYYGRYLPTKR